VIDDILKAWGAADQAVTVMGPLMTILFSWIGGWGVTQMLKFPIQRHCVVAWFDWSVRLTAVTSTLAFAHYLGNIDFPLEMVAAVTQPFIYTFATRAIRHYWPWTEATKGLIGSANPSDDSQRLKLSRDQQRALKDAGDDSSKTP
jgi:hypothetical protein